MSASRSRLWWAALIALAALCLGPPAGAQGAAPPPQTPSAAVAATASTESTAPTAPAPDDAPRWRYVVGLSTAFTPDEVGSSAHRWKVRPLWAVRLGRVRIATSRAASLLAFATHEPPETGASTDLFDAGAWRLRAALRYDQGRDELGSVDQRPGLPPVRPTLRARLTLGRPLAPGLGGSLNVTQDILGRDQGATLGADLGYSRMVGAATQWGLGLGLTAADARYMQSHFGLTAEQALHSGWAPHTPGAGLRDVHLSTGLTTALTPTWLAYVQVNVTRLVGPAAASPLVRSALGTELAFGVAWRCCGQAQP